MENFVIRRMEEKDIPRITEMEKEYFSDPWSEQAFVDALSEKNQVFFCMTVNDVIAGYCGIMMVLDEGQILNVAVDKSFRRQGLGVKMLKSVFEFGKENGLNIFTLEVRESNTPARELYKKLGFVETGKRPRYYTDPVETAVLMDLNLE